MNITIGIYFIIKLLVFLCLEKELETIICVITQYTLFIAINTAGLLLPLFALEIFLCTLLRVLDDNL